MVRELTSFGPGIRPSATIWSNSDGETPMYMADSSRERPRRGIGRVSERARAMASARMSAYRSLQIVQAVAHRAERRLVVPAVGGRRVETPALAMQPDQLATDGKLLLQSVWGHPAALRADVAGRHSAQGNFLVSVRVRTISPISKRASVQTHMAAGQV